MCNEREFIPGQYMDIDPATGQTVKYLNGKEFATPLTISELCTMLPDMFMVGKDFNGYDALFVTKTDGVPSKITLWDGTTNTDHEAARIRGIGAWHPHTPRKS